MNRTYTQADYQIVKALKFHPECTRLPWMGKDDSGAMEESVLNHGVRKPPKMLWRPGDENHMSIFDGRHRIHAWLRNVEGDKFGTDGKDELTIEEVIISDAELIEMIWDENVNRRHMTTSQKAIYGAELYHDHTSRQCINALPTQQRGNIIARLGISPRIFANALYIIRASKHKDDAGKIALKAVNDIAQGLPGVSVGGAYQTIKGMIDREIAEQAKDSEFSDAVSAEDEAANFDARFADEPQTDVAEIEEHYGTTGEFPPQSPQNDHTGTSSDDEQSDTVLFATVSGEGESEDRAKYELQEEQAIGLSPYYQRDGITIYHADSADIIEDIRYDLLVTDPPYGIHYRSNRRSERFDEITGDDEYPLWIFDHMASRATFVFCRWDSLAELPRPTSLIVWDKGVHSMGDLQHEYGRQWEAIAFYPGDEHEFTTRPTDVIHVPRVAASNMVHPTEKPVAVFQSLISHNVGDVVLDPFCGSGASLMAAKQLGRKAIGIEIEERYCEIAANRLDQTIMH